MSQRPKNAPSKQTKTYALRASQQQHLSEKAVTLTRELNEPVGCRHVLDAMFSLGMEFDDQVLLEAVQRSMTNSPRSSAFK